MHPELQRERLDFYPPECQLNDIHSDARSSGEQELLCVPASVCSQVHLFLICGCDFGSEPWSECRDCDDIMKNNKHLLPALRGNQREINYSDNDERSDANKLCKDISDKWTSMTFDVWRPVLYVRFDCWSWTTCVCLQKKGHLGEKHLTEKLEQQQAMQRRSVLLCLSTNCRVMERGLEENMLLCNIVPGALCYPCMLFPLGL